MTIKSTFAYIDPATLTVDLRVQRPADTTRVCALYIDFDQNKMGTIIVSQRADGTRVVLDGQTRLGAWVKAGSVGQVHAQIYTGLTLEQEASMFLAYNNSKPVSALDKFLVRVTEGDPVATAITSILAMHGWRVVKGGKDGTIQSVVALEHAYTRAGANGDRVVGMIIGAITKAWGYDFAGANASLISGLAELIMRYGDGIDQAKLIRELQSTNPRTLLGRARGMKESRVFSEALPIIVGRVLHTLHNQKLSRNKLADWK